MNAAAALQAPRFSELAALGASIALHVAAVLGIAFLTLSPPREGPAVPVELLFEAPPAAAEGPAVQSFSPVPVSPPAEPQPQPDLALQPAPLPPRPKPRAEPVPQPAPATAALPAVPLAEAPATAPQPALETSPAVPSPQVAAAPSYGGTLMRWLERYRDYPRAARLRRVEGVVVLRLTIERSGRLTDVSVAESSGSPLLDDAALDMVRRAVPLPPLPQGEGVERVVTLVPITFRLSRNVG